MKKVTGWKTKGMNQDMSVSAFNSEFSFENINLRLSTNEGNTTMSWVNERGTALMKDSSGQELSITGIPLGTAVLNHKLIVFFAGEYDYIYEFTIVDENTHKLNAKMLYMGHLNFDVQYPIETLTSYESKEAQKIYWTDFNNQPRIINIYNYEETAREFTVTGSIDTIFDFVPTVMLDESVTVSKELTINGTFAPGVIQYCLAYYNKYGQQTNIVYVSPIYYLAHPDRGASPEEKISCAFRINVSDIDQNFEYLRLYSVQRTSINADPIVRIVTDLKIGENTSLEFIDTGIYGTAMDPTELLFIGGKPIKVLTMAEKDQTLFMGNITQENFDISKLQDYILEHLLPPTFDNSKTVTLEQPNTFYPYKNSLGGSNNNEDITTFKGGEWYRFGVQLQRKTGEWSEPIYIGDAYNNKYPKIIAGSSERAYQLVQAQIQFNILEMAQEAGVSLDDYVKIRPVIVFPTAAERAVLCQGVLNPTVFNAEDRLNKSPYSQASWFFRPYGEDNSSFGAGEISTNAEYRHYYSLPSHASINFMNNGPLPSTSAVMKAARNIEIQGSADKYAKTEGGNKIPSVYGTDTGANTNNQFFVDQSIVTFNSPEIDFDPNIQTSSLDGTKLRIVGYIDVDSSASSHTITTSSNKVLSAQNLEVVNGMSRSEIDAVDQLEGKGESYENVFYNVGQGRYKGSRMITTNIWNDGIFLYNHGGDGTYDILTNDPKFHYYKGDYWNYFEVEGENNPTTHVWPVNFFVHPWHASRSLNNDWRAASEQSSMLKTKRMANLLYSYNTHYLNSIVDYPKIKAKIHLQENEQIYKINLDNQSSRSSDISYFPNIDKTLYNADGYYPLYETYTEEAGKRYDLLYYRDVGAMQARVSNAIEMKYKSTSHAVIALNDPEEGVGNGKIPIMPSLTIVSGSLTRERYGVNSFDTDEVTFWGDRGVRFYQPDIALNIAQQEYDWEHKRPKILWLGELYRELTPDTLFGGRTKEAIRNNTWLIAGEADDIKENYSPNIVWSQGDTYYQRYDCLKTYPFTKEDKNQLIEILSFMCETHVNIDGRYDANRGSTNNVNVSPQNFNLINDVYSQLNNFFTSRQISSESSNLEYPNMITYSKTKSSAADVDLWTNVTLASTLELDGSKGQITSLNRFNDQIIAFQDKAVSQVLYNENVQISSTQGVPIEIANSGKVQGKRYLSDFIGCSNKWSITHTPAGIYFMDSNNKGIYMFDGAIKNLSGGLGFNTWSKKNIPSSQSIWNPKTFDSFVSYYDAQNQDVLFINKKTCLAYSEKMGTFTSFYNYENTPYFCNLDDIDVWIKPNNNETQLWHHQTGNYCNFFGQSKSYSMTLVGNPEPQMDKIFTNLEFRASVKGDGEYDESTGRFSFSLPFDYLEVWNEYQHGRTNLLQKWGHAAHLHLNSGSSNLQRKFRIWRCDIPRDNIEILTKLPENPTLEDRVAYLQYQADVLKGIDRIKAHPNDRMRNPWLYLKLTKNRKTDEKAEIHDLLMTYYL